MAKKVATKKTRKRNAKKPQSMRSFAAGLNALHKMGRSKRAKKKKAKKNPKFKPQSRKSVTKRGVAAKRSKGARRNARRRNGSPSDADKAKAIYKSFHGKASNSHKTVMVRKHIPTDVAELGRLVELKIKPVTGGPAVIAKPAGVTVACSPDGSQLYFIGGDQVPRLSDFGITKPHELEELGTLTKLVYFTKKGFHNFAPIEYSHQMGEDGGRAPSICFNSLEKVLYLNGGTYRVKPEGITH